MRHCTHPINTILHTPINMSLHNPIFTSHHASNKHVTSHPSRTALHMSTRHVTLTYWRKRNSNGICKLPAALGGGQSPACHRGEPASIPEQFVWNLWWIGERFLSLKFHFPLSINITPMHQRFNGIHSSFGRVTTNPIQAAAHEDIETPLSQCFFFLL